MNKFLRSALLVLTMTLVTSSMLLAQTVHQVAAGDSTLRDALVAAADGDIIELTGTGRAPCGRTAPRFRVVGRADDMVVIRGINAFPTQVAATINQFDGLSGEYRIVLPGPGPYDVLPVEAELAAGTATDDGLAAAVETRLKRDIGITAKVTIVPFNTLPRTEGKTRRIIRKDRL